MTPSSNTLLTLAIALAINLLAAFCTVGTVFQICKSILGYLNRKRKKQELTQSEIDSTSFSESLRILSDKLNLSNNEKETIRKELVWYHRITALSGVVFVLLAVAGGYWLWSLWPRTVAPNKIHFDSVEVMTLKEKWLLKHPWLVLQVVSFSEEGEKSIETKQVTDFKLIKASARTLGEFTDGYQSSVFNCQVSVSSEYEFTGAVFLLEREYFRHLDHIVAPNGTIKFTIPSSSPEASLVIIGRLSKLTPGTFPETYNKLVTLEKSQ